MGKKGRHAETGMEAQSHGQEVPHPRVMDKNQEGYLSSKVSQAYTRQPSLGFQCQEDTSL